jgi:hypothetical protein
MELVPLMEHLPPDPVHLRKERDKEMQIYEGIDRATSAGSSTLEDEVAAWLRRRAVRPSATSGRVRVVRIPKRMPSRIDRSARTSDDKPLMA